MTFRRFIAVAFVATAFMTGSLGSAAAASRTVRMAIVHVVRGCHTWSVGSKLARPSRTLTLERGTKLVIRVNCPMDFDFSQRSGPSLRLGPRRTYAGTTRTIVFRKSGVYKLKAKNVQSSEEMGLETLGPDNRLMLTVRVK